MLRRLLLLLVRFYLLAGTVHAVHDGLLPGIAEGEVRARLRGCAQARAFQDTIGELAHAAQAVGLGFGLILLMATCSNATSC
jgi:hypothetical protein